MPPTQFPMLTSYITTVCTCSVASVMSSSLQPHGLYPTRLLCLWGLSRQEYWSGLPCPPLGDLPHPGIKTMTLMSPVLAGRFFTTEPLGKPHYHDMFVQTKKLTLVTVTLLTNQTPDVMWISPASPVMSSFSPRIKPPVPHYMQLSHLPCVLCSCSLS